MRLRDLEDWYTSAQVEKRIGRSRQGVLDLAEDGRIRAVRVGKNVPGARGFWAFDPESVEKFAHEQEEKKG
jgi:hypothetical protein